MKTMANQRCSVSLVYRVRATIHLTRDKTNFNINLLIIGDTIVYKPCDPWEVVGHFVLC